MSDEEFAKHNTAEYEVPTIEEILNLCVKRGPSVGKFMPPNLTDSFIHERKSALDTKVMQERDYFFPGMQVAKVTICHGE